MTEAQKKKLPSWIRDGLEKMEREKIKKEEEKERIRRTDEKKRKQREEETRLSKDPTASKFDNDLSEEEDERRESPPRKRKSRFETKETRDERRHDRARESKEEEEEESGRKRMDKAASSSMAVEKSKEEILQDNTITLRRTLTEVLLEVTKEEIAGITGEVMSKAKSKNSSRPLKTMLSGYGSDSESESERSESDDDLPSDQELRDSLKRKKKHFARLEEKIVAQCDEEEILYKQR